MSPRVLGLASAGVGPRPTYTPLHWIRDLYSDLLDRSYSILAECPLLYSPCHAIGGFDLVRIARCRWFDSGTTRAFYESLNLEAPESQYDSLVRLLEGSRDLGAGSGSLTVRGQTYLSPRVLGFQVGDILPTHKLSTYTIPSVEVGRSGGM